MSVADNKPKFEKRDQACNFNVQPVAVKLQNSETKKIGDNLGNFRKNIIDEDFLKKSHVPFANVRQKIANANASAPAVNMKFSTSPYAAPHSSAQQIKHGSENSKLPFSPTRRGKADDARDPFAGLSKTQYMWQTPTVMQNF